MSRFTFGEIAFAKFTFEDSLGEELKATVFRPCLAGRQAQGEK